MDDLIYVGNTDDLSFALNENILYRYGINWLSENEFEIYNKPTDLGLIPYERFQQALIKMGIGAKLHFVLKKDQYNTHLLLKCKSIIGVNPAILLFILLPVITGLPSLPFLFTSVSDNLFYPLLVALIALTFLLIGLQKGYKEEIAYKHKLIIDELKQL